MLFMAACFLFAQASILTSAVAIFCAAPHGSGGTPNEFVRIFRPFACDAEQNAGRRSRMLMLPRPTAARHLG
jgi:hypothetical protein